jgi:hypothetical protein
VPGVRPALAECGAVRTARSNGVRRIMFESLEARSCVEADGYISHLTASSVAAKPRTAIVRNIFVSVGIWAKN